MRNKLGKLITIVLADDQIEVRNALRRYLDRDGRFSILAEAADGAQALRRVTLLQPDALILDLAMPNLNGLEALPKIRDASPKTKIVILSVMVPFDGIESQALALGAIAAFDKYISPKIVIARLVAEFS